MLLDGSGSQLRVSITVSHHSDWWLSLLHTEELPRRQTSKLNTSSTLNTTHITSSSKTSATWFRFSYFTLIEWHLLVVVRWSVSAPRVVVSYTVRWGQTDAATVRAEGGIPPPSGRWTGLLHLLWEADCRGWGMRDGGWAISRGIGILAQTLTQTSRGYSTVGTRKRQRSRMEEQVNLLW